MRERFRVQWYSNVSHGGGFYRYSYTASPSVYAEDEKEMEGERKNSGGSWKTEREGEGEFGISMRRTESPRFPRTAAPV